MELDTVETCFVDGSISCVGIPLDVGLYFIHGESTRGRLVVRGRNFGWCDEIETWILRLELIWVCGTTEGPELEEDVGAVGMHRIYDL